MVIAATNHEEALDAALFRRFDDIVRYDAPDLAQLEAVMRNVLACANTVGVDWARAAKEAEGFSHAEATTAAAEAFKRQLLDERDAVTTEDLLHSIRERRRPW